MRSTQIEFGVSARLTLGTNLSSHGQSRDKTEKETSSWVETLLEKLSDGDSSAFWPLWEHYQDYLYHRCLSWMGGNRSQAQDALSEIMLKAWEKLPKFAAKITNLKGWLTKLARNFCIDRHRENNSGAIGVENLEGMAVPEGNGLVTEFDTPDLVVEKRELLEVIQSALEDLPENQRQVCVLRFEQELSHQEIAQRLAISNDSVRKRIQRARKILQERLTKYLAGLDEKAYGEIAKLQKIRGVEEQESKEQKDEESDVTPSDKEIGKGEQETTENSESLRPMPVSESASVEEPSKDLDKTRVEITSLDKPDLAVEPAVEITSLDKPALAVEPGSEVPKVILINKAPRSRNSKSQQILSRPRSSQALLPLAGKSLLGSTPNPQSNQGSVRNTIQSHGVKLVTPQKIAISPPLLEHGSIEAPIAKDLSQFSILVLARIVSWWGIFKIKVEPRCHQRLDQWDRGPPF
ncbi:RNA polymerase sigma factor [Moorena producens JHB]|uniref:RNA polymerase sigma factor n=1 Tax=Moorena producens (strain JHB) TaxID=1454205 RepID=A0A1D9FTE2_MOOP1|nr:RNA polymerase sigma factor [Moorena producens]AOY78544.1 RNA polymerase sigma factor [Moorena producens JHB]